MNDRQPGSASPPDDRADVEERDAVHDGTGELHDEDEVAVVGGSSVSRDHGRWLRFGPRDQSFAEYRRNSGR